MSTPSSQSGSPSWMRCLLLAGSAPAALVATQGFAQDISPVRIQIDEHSVDLASGGINIASPSISIGIPGESGMTYTRSRRGQGATDNYNLTLTKPHPASTQIYVDSGQQTEWFTLTNGVYVSNQGTQNTAIDNGNGTFTYRSGDGETITFGLLTFIQGVYYPQTVQRPSGERLTYYHRSQVGQAELFPGYSLQYKVVRTQSVKSNYGYLLKFEYSLNTITDWNSISLFIRRTSAKLINNAVDTCNPAADTCTGLTQNWPGFTFTYAPSGLDTIETVTDSLGRQTKFRINSNSQLSGITKPGSTSDDITVNYDENYQVSSTTNSGLTYNYTWSVSGNTLTATVSDAGGLIRTTTADTTNRTLLTSTNALGQTTTNTYDASGRPTQTTLPEGNSVQYTYDARGNLTQTTRVAKPGSGLANLVTSASYPATCTITTLATCNKPVWTRDEKNNQTDYTYDATHGGVLTVTSPAATAGAARPQVRYSYSPLQAYFKNTVGTIVASGQPIYKLTGTSTCLTATAANPASCVGTADESKTTTAYGPQTAGVANNLLPVSTTAASGNNAISATSTATYDVVGNVATVDGPLAGTGDTTAFRFDAVRNVTGVIGPDPDGAGALPNAATRITRDSRDRVVLTEQGITMGQTTTDWNAFIPGASTAATYNGRDQVLTQTLKNGTTAYSLTQTSYDAQGRAECTAVRMNTASYGALPASACTPVAGAGDRITAPTYDAGDRVIQVQSGLGTASLATESTGYTVNGKTAHVVDANLNRTTYEYDGHDRLIKTRYPVTTKGSNASSTTDFEQLTYGENVQITAVRLRGEASDMAIAYDNLGRVTTQTPPSEPQIAINYNLQGMVTQVTRNGLTVANTYDALGRRLSETQPYGAVSYQYNPAGAMTRLTWADGLYAGYDYDNAGRVTAIRENGALSGLGVLASYTYDSLGRRLGVAYGNGTSRTYAWDGVNRLTGLNINLAGTTSDLVIGQVAMAGTAIAYNPASQITSIARSNDGYAYTERYGVNRAYTQNGLNQYGVAGALTLGYDARGNLTSSGSDAYGYSKLNELKTGPNGTVLTYDGLGRLVQYDAPQTTRLLYGGSMLLAELSSANAMLRRYVPGPGMDEPVVWYEGAGTTDRRWLQADERGSVVAVSDASGAVLAINRYDEHGIPQAGGLGRFRYTGQTWFSELGMYNYKARFYSATLGRFMQTDPIGYGDGLNWYAYVGGDPVNKVDPSGLCDSVAADYLGGCEIIVTGHPWTGPSGDAGLIGISQPSFPVGFSDFGAQVFDNANATPQKAAQPRGPCSNSKSTAGKIAARANEVAEFTDGLALGLALAAAATSETVVGGVVFGAAAATAEVTSKVSNVVAIVANLADGNTSAAGAGAFNFVVGNTIARGLKGATHINSQYGGATGGPTTDFLSNAAGWSGGKAAEAAICGNR